MSRASEEAKTIIAVPNDQNGVTAYMTLYAAINRNTENPDQAFDLLDFMFSDEVMTGAGFATEDSDIKYGNGIISPSKWYSDKCGSCTTVSA